MHTVTPAAPASSSRPTGIVRSASSLLAAGVIAATALLLGGCSILPAPTPDPTKYFVLTGPPPPETSAEPRADGGLKVGLNAIEVTSFLKGRSMIVRSGTNELAYQDYARWAEPLDIGIGRLVKGQLLAAPTVTHVFAYPFPFDGERDYDVNITVVRCEGAREGSRTVAKFEAVIEISTTGAGAHAVSRKVFTAPDVAWDGRDFGALAAALSESVLEMSKAVVAALPAK